MLQNAHTQYYQFTMIVRHLIEIEWRMMGKTNRIFFSHSARAHGTTNSLFFFSLFHHPIIWRIIGYFSLTHTHTHCIWLYYKNIIWSHLTIFTHTQFFLFESLDFVQTLQQNVPKEKKIFSSVMDSFVFVEIFVFRMFSRW